MTRTTIVLTVAALICSSIFAQKRDANERRERGEQGRVERTGDRGRAEEGNVDWDKKYDEFLKNNPTVKAAVENGKITKEKVIAGIKTRWEESQPSEEEQLETIYQQILRDHPELKGRVTKEQLMPRLKVMLAQQRRKEDEHAHAGSSLRGRYAYRERWTAEELTRAEATLKKQAQADGCLKQVLRAVEQTMVELQIEGDDFVVDPARSVELEKLGLANVQITLIVGLAQKQWVDVVDNNMGVTVQEYNKILSGARRESKSDELDPRLVGTLQFSMDSGNRALKKHMDSTVEQKIMTREEADALLARTKVDSLVDWEATYQQFLKDNPKIKAKVDSGEWTKEQVMTLVKQRR